jgi:protein ImuB
MKARTAKSRTADLFAEADASPARIPIPPSLAPSTLTPASAPTPALPRAQRSAPRVLKAGGIPPTPQTAVRVRSKQLWYAVVFPELVSMEHSAAVLQRLCLHAQRFTSFVSIEPPNALLLEIKGSLKLFGSLERLHAGIDACWRNLALPAHSATAPSTLAALWLARGGQPRAGTPGTGQPIDSGHPGPRPAGALRASAPASCLRIAGHPIRIEDLGALAGHLAKLPIACTAWDIERLQTLRAMGVTRVGELLRLPRAGLARRLGPAAVQDLDVALARQFAPRRVFVPRERFRARCDFETEIENVAYLEKALEPLIARCAQFLRERQAGVQALRLKLRHRAGPATRVHLGLASITGERRRLMDVLAQKLGRLALEAPVRGMELVSGSLQPLSANSLDIFAGLAGTGAGTGAGCGRDSVPQLVERLRARLGEEAVYGVASIPEHRPEAAWRRVYEPSLASARRMGEKMTERGTGDGMPRPVWLLDAPLAISLKPEPTPAGRPQGEGQDGPSQCGGRKPEPTPEGAPEGRGPRMGPRQCGLVLEQGPERIESGWWDGRGVARDYYVARQCGGRTPEPTPAGRPQGEGQDGPSQCEGRTPEPTPVGAPEGRGPRMGPRQSQPHGAKLWVFQERLSKRWYVHGVFA